jgi:hypothetical protein
MPSASGLWNNTSTNTLNYTLGTYNYKGVGSQVLTLSCSKVHTINGFDYFWGTQNTTIGGIHIQSGIPFAGIPFFLGDYLAAGVDKLAAMLDIGSSIFFPPSQIPASISNLIFFFAYVPFYAMFAIGIYSLVAEVIGRVI